MQEKEIKLLFDSGELKNVTILAMPMESGWYIQFERKHGKPFPMSAQRSSPRVFKTLDASFRTIQSIVFRQASIIRE